MTLLDLTAITRSIRFRDWTFRVGRDGSDAYYLQVAFIALDRTDGEYKILAGRKWRLSVHSTKGEVVQTALKAVLTALEHEARESFLYKGQPIYSPHFDPDALLSLAEHPSSLEHRATPA